MSRCRNLHLRVGALLVALALGAGATAAQAQSQTLEQLKNRAPFKGKQPIDEFLSAGGLAAMFGPDEPISSPGELKRGGHDNGRGGNTFTNDACLDPQPPTSRRTVQSETEIAVLNRPGSMGKKMVAGYNDSYGFYDNRQGLSGFTYSTDGGNTWIDGGGLPPRVPLVGTGAGGSTFPSGTDRYFGDPVIVVHHSSQTFYYASIYQSTAGYFTLSVNRGRFRVAPPQGVESVSNTRCLNQPEEHGIPDPPKNQDERIIWELPVEAVLPPFLGVPLPLPGGGELQNPDFLDKEWLYVDQNSGTLYMTYTRFAGDLSTPIELVRCVGCANSATFSTGMFTPPSVIVPNEAFEFNQATQPFTTPSGRVIVTWFAREFGMAAPFPEIEQRIEYAYSDDDGVTFTPEKLVAEVDPQGEPPGYNRRRLTILNAPYIFVDRGSDDGVFTSQERARPGFGNVYITYFDGVTKLPQTVPPTASRPECRAPNVLSQSDCNPFARAARILLSTSSNNGTTFGPPVQVNDDATLTTHVFPSVQANKNGDVYAAWIDRRQDPDAFIPGVLKPGTGTPPGPPTVITAPGGGNIFNDTYAAVSKSLGASFGHNKVQTDVSSSWFTRADARPNYGDYNSSELLGFNQFVTIWADGRFRPPGGPAATPDAIFTIGQGLGVGTNPNPDR